MGQRFQTRFKWFTQRSFENRDFLFQFNNFLRAILPPCKVIDDIVENVDIVSHCWCLLCHGGLLSLQNVESRWLSKKTTLSSSSLSLSLSSDSKVDITEHLWRNFWSHAVQQFGTGVGEEAKDGSSVPVIDDESSSLWPFELDKTLLKV